MIRKIKKSEMSKNSKNLKILKILNNCTTCASKWDTFQKSEILKILNKFWKSSTPNPSSNSLSVHGKKTRRLEIEKLRKKSYHQSGTQKLLGKQESHATYCQNIRMSELWAEWWSPGPGPTGPDLIGRAAAQLWGKCEKCENVPHFVVLVVPCSMVPHFCGTSVVHSIPTLKNQIPDSRLRIKKT